MWWTGETHSVLISCQQGWLGSDTSIPCKAGPVPGSASLSLDSKQMTQDNHHPSFLSMGNRFPNTGPSSLGTHVWGKNIKTPIFQGTEYESRDSSRTVKMLPFPPNSPISRILTPIGRNRHHSKHPATFGLGCLPQNSYCPCLHPPKSRNLF